MLCATFNWGRLPFDKQFCPVDIRSFSYGAEDVVVEWPGQKYTAAYISSEWLVLAGARWSEISKGKGSARLCIELQRESNTYRFTLCVSVLLVAASSLGFYLPVSAAPARVALAFLCFLMVLNNLNAVLAR